MAETPSGAQSLSPEQMNALAKKVGTIANEIEAEYKRHGERIARLTEKLDSVYEKLGAEALDV